MEIYVYICLFKFITFTYIVIKRSTSKFILAATTAKPNRIKTKLKATYPGLLESA